MMANKHLHELLKEDQEPFHLKNYIADRRCQLKSPSNPKTTLRAKKRKPFVNESSSSSLAVSKKHGFCKHACFLSFHDSPADVRRSPFLEFPSPAKSPCKAQNGGVLLHVPARTAALLLEAAIRIQKQQRKQSSSSKSKSQIKNVGFGLFGSILKKLKDRNRKKKHEIEDIKNVNVGKNTVIEAKEEEEDRRSAYEMGLSCSCNNSRLSSAGWSESNEEKSMDLDSSSSCSRSEEESMEEAFVSCEKRLCSSPLSPFRFALQKSLSSSGRRTPDFSSPAASPSHHNEEEKDKFEAKGLNDIETEDEEKEQCSPVSVLDPPFEEDDDDGHEGGDEDDGLECSYAIVQRAKQQLLDKLRRFEKLAELDPVELEKRMIEQMDDQDCEDEAEYDEYHKDDDSSPLHDNIGSDLDTLATEVLIESSFQQAREIPADMKMLVSDLLSEETKNVNGFQNDGVVQRVCNRLSSWKEVQSNTIDMMVQLDFGREFNGWKKYQEQIVEITAEIEHAVCMVLLEELAEELLD